jgi:hypothetical protein
MAEWPLQLVGEDETDRVPVRQSAIGTTVTLIQALFDFDWVAMFCKVVDP